MPRNAVKISKEEFKQKLEDQIRAHDDYEPSNDWKGNELPPISYHSGYVLRSLNKKVDKDLSKIQFDLENFECGNSDTSHDGSHKVVGIHSLPSGLTFLGCQAGGDWEYPVYFIIYWDGKMMRGYIPKNGNYYNKKAKAAFGNDPDGSDLEEGYNYGNHDNHNDFDAMIKDIENRIQID